MNWKRFLLAFLAILFLSGCQSNTTTDKGHADTIKLTRNFYNYLHAQDYETVIVNYSCIGEEQPNFQIGPNEKTIMQSAFPWLNQQLTQVTELDYSDSIAHMQLSLNDGTNTTQEEITLKNYNNIWCVDILPTITPFLK